MKPKPASEYPETIEGPEAWERFRNAVSTVLTVPKSVVLKDQKKRQADRKKRGRKQT
jgi:hypothetical protein